jgi:hypothetical protein
MQTEMDCASQHFFNWRTTDAQLAHKERPRMLVRQCASAPVPFKGRRNWSGANSAPSWTAPLRQILDWRDYELAGRLAALCGRGLDPGCDPDQAPSTFGDDT